MGVLEVAASEELVLTHVGNHDGLVVGSLADTAYHLAHEQGTVLGVQRGIYHLIVLLLGVRLETVYPCLMSGRFHKFGYLCQSLLAVAQYRHGGFHYLAHLGGVYLEVYHLGLLGVGVQVARNTVVEAHAHGNEQVALVGHHVGSQIAMHAQHTHVQGMAGGSGGKAEHGLSEGYLCLLAKGKEFLACTGKFHTLANEHQGLHALVDEFGRHFYASRLCLGHGVVTADEVHRLRSILYHCRLCVLGKVQYHRTGTAAACYVEGTCHRPRDVLGTAYLIVPLADRLGNAHYVHLLKGIRAKHGGTHLSADYHHGGGVYHGICHTGDGVHGTGTRGNDGASHLTAHTGIALGCMYGRLFVAYEYVVQGVLVVVKGIIGGHDGTTGISEQHIHSLVFKGAHKGFGTCYLCCLHKSEDPPPYPSLYGGEYDVLEGIYSIIDISLLYALCTLLYG